MKKFAMILILCVALLAACGDVGVDEEMDAVDTDLQLPVYTRITAEQAVEMMAGDVVILDVRRPDEFNEGHIRNAVLLPVDEISDRATEVIEDKNQVILVYCRSGVRSLRAAAALIELGFVNVYEFGGIIDWAGEVVVPYSHLPHCQAKCDSSLEKA